MDNHRNSTELQEETCYSIEISQEEKKKILRQRAYLIKAEPEKEETVTEQLSGIEFLLGNEHYFIESQFVSEVIQLKEMAPLPGTPPFLLGIINVRGKILAVINLRNILNLPEAVESGHGMVILTKHSGVEAGILADEIAGIRFLSVNGLQEIIPGITGTQNDYISGVTKDGLILLNFRKFILDNKIKINSTK